MIQSNTFNDLSVLHVNESQVERATTRPDFILQQRRDLFRSWAGPGPGTSQRGHTAPYRERHPASATPSLAPPRAG